MRKAITLFPVALALSLSSCAGAIDKALYSVAEGLTEKDKITGLRSLSLQDRKAQIEQADSHAASILQKYGGNINEKVSRSQYRRLKRIFDRIHKISHFRNEKWTVVLLPEKSFNAFVTGGTFVFANLGFMEFCNDDEVAAVIGHEIGHITANHAFEQHSYMLAASLADAKNLKKEGYAEAFNRNQEDEADKIGVLYAALAGYDPDAASKVWVKLGGSRAHLTRTHPMNEQRARNTEIYAKQVRQYYTPGKINPDFEQLLVKNVLWDASGGEAKAGEGGGLAAVLSAAFDTTIKHYGAKMERKDMERRVKSGIERENRKRHAQSKTQIISAVSQVLSQYGQPQLSADGGSLTATFTYAGTAQVSNIEIEAEITIPGYEPLVLRADSGGPITAGMSFIVRFSDPSLALYSPYLQNGQADLSFRIADVLL